MGIIKYFITIIIMNLSNFKRKSINFSKGFELKVAQWDVEWYSWIDKFWENTEITTWTDPEDIWRFGWTYNYTVNTWVTHYFSSSNNWDTQTIKFQCLTVDSSDNWNLENFEQELVWQTKTELTPGSWNKIVRIFRAENQWTTDLAWILYVYENDTVTTWVPDTDNKVRLIIDDWDNQTLMAIYTIPTWYVWFLMKWEVWLSFSAWPSATDYAKIDYRSRRFWEIFKTKKRICLITTWTSIYKNLRSIPDPIPAKTDIKLTVWQVSDTMWVWGAFDILLVEEDELSDEYLTSIWQIKRMPDITAPSKTWENFTSLDTQWASFNWTMTFDELVEWTDSVVMSNWWTITSTTWYWTTTLTISWVAPNTDNTQITAIVYDENWNRRTITSNVYDLF